MIGAQFPGIPRPSRMVPRDRESTALEGRARPFESPDVVSLPTVDRKRDAGEHGEGAVAVDAHLGGVPIPGLSVPPLDRVVRHQKMLPMLKWSLPIGGGLYSFVSPQP